MKKKNIVEAKISDLKKIAAKKTTAKKVAVKKAAPAAKKVAAKKSAAPGKATLKDRIISVLDGGSRFAAVATVGADNRPYVRIMSLAHKGLDISSASFMKSRKIAHIEKNPNVSITVLKDYQSMMSDYIRIEAVARVRSDAKTRKEHWSEGLGFYFKGPDDPNYCIIEFKPVSIEFNDGETFQTEIYKPGRR